MNYTELGRTGLKISEVGFGCIPIIRLSNDGAKNVLRHAFNCGINFFDTANLYRDSEYKIGQALTDVRDKIVIATKTTRRDRAGFTENLENSLRMLRTDYIDLFQFHQVATETEWEKLMAPDGAFEEANRAIDQGKIKSLGITSHNLEMAVKLVKTGLFSTIQFPFNFIEPAAKDELHKIAAEKKIGVIVMKPFAGGVIDSAEIAFKFLRQFPGIIPIPGFDSIESIDEIVSIYEKPNEVDKKDIATMNRYIEELGSNFCRRCEYCQPCPNGVRITPAMGYNIVAMRMSPAVSVDFLKETMATVGSCTECCECIEKCPYNLNIPELLKKNYALYEKHLSEVKRV